MGRLIDETDLMNLLYASDDARHDLYYTIKKVPELPTVEAIPKDQYEARLKADMVAILEELKKEIEELPFPQREPEYMQGYSYCQTNILDYVIQEKINQIRGDKDETISL